jgi:hypothetical protein
MNHSLELGLFPAIPGDIRAIQLCIRELVMGTDRRPTKRGSRRFWEESGAIVGSASPIMRANEWPRIAPFLTTGNGRSWRRLSELRRNVRLWDEFLDSSVRDEHWMTFLFDACCARPEEIPQQCHTSKQRRHIARVKIAAALACTPLLPLDNRPTCLRPSDDDFEPGYEYRDVAPPESGGPPAWFTYDQARKLVAQGKSPDRQNWVAAGLTKVVNPQNHERLCVVVKRWRDRRRDDHMVRLVCDEITRERTDPVAQGDLAGLLLCAVKAAVWHRAHDYLNTYGRTSTGELTPAERRAAFVQASWLEIRAEESDLATMLRFLTPNIPEQKNTEGQGHRQLAAALELAYDDLATVNLLDTTPSRDDNWDAQRAAETILDQLVFFLRQGDDLDELLFRRTTGQSSRLLAVNPPRPAPKPPGRNNRSKPVEPPSERWLDHLVDLARDRPLRPGALRWIYDPANTQSMMAYLRSASHPQRTLLTQGLVTALITSITSSASRDPSILRSQMRVVNSAVWDIAATGDTGLFRFTEPLLLTVRPVESPFVGTLYRCHATLATKNLRHHVAFNQILRAEHATRDAGEQIAAEADDLERINYVEALQQVMLQKAGAEIRALEAFLISPRHRAYVTQREARELRRFAERLSTACMQDAGLAYSYLTTLEEDRLPETLQIGRVSTVGWRFNTRFQAARAAILKALINMATDKPSETELAMAALYYREASTAASTTSQICLLSQAALTYALLTGGRFLAPGDRLHSVLPPHLTTPWSSDGHLFDLEAASMYLSDHRFTARVMATLSWPAARIAMRRVEPPEMYPAWLANWSVGSQGDLSRRSKTVARG